MAWVVPLGKSEVLLVRPKALMAELERLLVEGTTVYDLPVPHGGR